MQIPNITELEGWLAASEAKVPNLRPDCVKSIVWAGKTAERTKVVVVYIHGFSATKHELRPLPDLVAASLNANLFFTRLTGHGRDGAAMGEASFEDWRADVAEAFRIGKSLGDEIIVMGCSTGCTLATDALARGAKAAGVVYISPNFGLTHTLARRVLDLPFARHWSHLIAGKTHSYDVKSPEHEAFWTTSYPTKSVYPMADAVRAVMKNADLGQITTPAFFAYNTADQVVSASQTEKVIGRWGGETTTHKLVQGQNDDTMGHLMAGDIFSPTQTKPVATEILRWFTAQHAR